jgi:hypothetical protein
LQRKVDSLRDIGCLRTAHPKIEASKVRESSNSDISLF